MFSLCRYKRTFKKSLREIINKFDLIKMKTEKDTSIHKKYQNWNTNKENFYRYHRWDICDMKHFIQICEKNLNFSRCKGKG